MFLITQDVYMNNESRPYPKAESLMESSINEPCGEISIPAEELAYLDEVRCGEYEKHPTLKGVFTRSLEVEKVPFEIRHVIEKLGAEISSFSVVKIENEVPLHQHVSDGEIYFYGTEGVVTLLNASKNKIGQYDFSINAYTVTRPGEWHGVASKNSAGSIFFGVKFVSKQVGK